MKSIGLDLQKWIENGLLQLHTSRISMFGLETHLLTMYRVIEDFRPAVVIVDPMPTLTDVGSAQQAKSVITRLIDFLKMRTITTMFTDLTREEKTGVPTEEEIPSLIDTWILLRDVEENYVRFRTLLILKSRGMAHSNTVCQFLMTDNGIRLSPLAQRAREREIILEVRWAFEGAATRQGQTSILNSAPRPTLRTFRVPPMFFSMMVFDMKRPSPVPLSGPLVVKYGSNNQVEHFWIWDDELWLCCRFWKLFQIDVFMYFVDECVSGIQASIEE